MFHQGFQTPRNNKSIIIISFSVFGTPDETLALVFDILHQEHIMDFLNDDYIFRELTFMIFRDKWSLCFIYLSIYLAFIKYLIQSLERFEIPTRSLGHA